MDKFKILFSVTTCKPRCAEENNGHDFTCPPFISTRKFLLDNFGMNAYFQSLRPLRAPSVLSSAMTGKPLLIP